MISNVALIFFRTFCEIQKFTLLVQNTKTEILFFVLSRNSKTSKERDEFLIYTNKIYV